VHNQRFAISQEELARKEGKDASAILEGADEERELFRRAGRRHSRLQDIEYQCWVFRYASMLPFYCTRGCYHMGD
jgi:hypothetical protein